MSPLIRTKLTVTERAAPVPSGGGRPDYEGGGGGTERTGTSNESRRWVGEEPLLRWWRGSSSKWRPSKDGGPESVHPTRRLDREVLRKTRSLHLVHPRGVPVESSSVLNVSVSVDKTIVSKQRMETHYHPRRRWVGVCDYSSCLEKNRDEFLCL